MVLDSEKTHMSTWEKVNSSEATKFVKNYWEDWFERELNASADTCMHNNMSGEHEYHMRTTKSRKTLVYVCKHCLEIVAPLEHYDGDSNEQ